MALDTYLFGRREDVKPGPVALDAIRRSSLIEYVDLMPLSIGNLDPLRIIISVTALTQLIIDDDRLGHRRLTLYDNRH